MSVSVCIRPPIITGSPDFERTWVVTDFSDVEGGFVVTVLDVEAAPCFETFAVTPTVIISSPETQPFICRVKPLVSSRVVDEYKPRLKKQKW